MPNKKSASHPQSSIAGGEEEVVRAGETEGQSPRVLLSTLHIARGLNFDPSVSHVFVLDPPRNTADFLGGTRAVRAVRPTRWTRARPRACPPLSQHPSCRRQRQQHM